MKRLALLCLFCASAFAVTKPTLPQLQVDTSPQPVTGKSIPVNAGADLQAAINTANSGDELVLQSGATWVGNYELPNKIGSGWITIRSSNMSKLPVPGNRVAPSDTANMPTIMAAGVSTAFHLANGAHNYRLMGLEITEKPGQSLNYGLIMQGDPNDANPADLPNHIVLDRCYVHGQVLSHIKFGWQMNGAYLAVVDSYFSEFHGLGQDTQAITGYMGTGPMKIVNNYLSGAGENILFGGAWDAIPNTTTADVTFTGNYLYKPASWYSQSLVPAPSSVNAVGGTGTLAAATYYYSVIAQGTVGTLDSFPGQAQSSRSAETKVVLSTAGSITLSWTEPTYGDSLDMRIADNYVIARTADAPGGNRAWTYLAYTPKAASGPLSFVDDGSKIPLSSFGEWARYWSVKNLFEIKNGVRWLVDSNIMEGNWVSSQNGFSVLFTPRNEMPVSMPGNTIQDITFTNNVLRHVAGGFNIGSEDDTAPLSVINPALVTARISIMNNLLEDVGYSYGGNGVALQFGAGAYPTLPGVQDLLFDHNTFFQSWSHAALGPADPAHPENRIGNFQFSNNVLGAGAYDWHFNSGGFDWTGSILPNFTSITTNNNVWAGAPWNAQYPANNFWPVSLNDVGFVNYAGGNGGDYHLTSASPYKGKADDGTDPGANIDTLNAVIAQDILGQTAPPVIVIPDPIPVPVLVVVPPIVIPPPPAIPTVWMQIVSRNSGKCLTGLTNATIAQYSCAITSDLQLFTLIPAYDANQKLLGYQFAMKNGLSLDVWGASGANGATIGQYGFQASSNEIFSLHQNAAGYFTITANNSGKCLDITGVSKLDGTRLEQWSCGTGTNQQWSLNVQSVQ